MNEKMCILCLKLRFELISLILYTTFSIAMYFPYPSLYNSLVLPRRVYLTIKASQITCNNNFLYAHDFMNGEIRCWSLSGSKGLISKEGRWLNSVAHRKRYYWSTAHVCNGISPMVIKEPPSLWKIWSLVHHPHLRRLNNTQALGQERLHGF